MDLLDLAIYVLPPYVIALFLFGVGYRLTKFILLWKKKPAPEPRKRGAGHLAINLIKTFLDPIIQGTKNKPQDFITGLVMLHIIGVIPLIFLLNHHMAVFSYWFPPYTLLAPFAIPLSVTSSGLTLFANVAPASEMNWDFVNTIWGPLTIILNGDVLAIMVILGASYKIGDKIVRLIHGIKHVRIGDFVALILVLAIVIFGFLAAHHQPSADITTYRNILGIHILLAEILVVILPFTKFWHFVFGFWFGKFHEWYDLKYKRGI